MENTMHVKSTLCGYAGKLSFSLLSIALLAGCAEEAAVVEQPLRPVRFIEAVQTGTAQQLTFSGTSHAGLESRLSFKVSGTLKRKKIKVGDEVKKGQLLLALDPKDYQISLQQAQANLNSAKAAQRNAQANYDRTRLLYENNNASATDLDAARANADSAKANVSSSTQQVASARNQLKYTELRSPDHCAVASVDIRENENVSPAQQVAQLNCGEEPKVEFSIPENYISQINAGDLATVTFDAVPNNSYEARVTEVGIAASAGSAYPVTVKLVKQDSNIRAGMAASVLLSLAEGKADEKVIYVPTTSVAADQKGRFVWVVFDTNEAGVGQVSRKDVEIGKLTARGMELLSGITAGDKVVIAGRDFMSESLLVKMPIVEAVAE
jgi:RND family efflux transporter MFP subunit